jgi:2-keto-3-deoxy-6-phosphogluconate aldolase
MTAKTRHQKLAELFKQAGVIPVLTIERLEDAVPLAKALAAGGVRTRTIWPTRKRSAPNSGSAPAPRRIC